MARSRIWQMDGLNFIAGQNVGPNVGPELGRDGRERLQRRRQGRHPLAECRRQPAIWLMDGFNLISGTNVGPFNPGPSWHVIDQNHLV